MWSLLGLALFMQCDSLEIHPTVVVVDISGLLLFMAGELYMLWLYHGVLSHSPIERNPSSFEKVWLFKQSCCEQLMYRFLCEQKSSFLWDKRPEMQILGCMEVTYLAF